MATACILCQLNNINFNNIRTRNYHGKTLKKMLPVTLQHCGELES